MIIANHFLPSPITSSRRRNIAPLNTISSATGANTPTARYPQGVPKSLVISSSVSFGMSTSNTSIIHCEGMIVPKESKTTHTKAVQGRVAIYSLEYGDHRLQRKIMMVSNPLKAVPAAIVIADSIP